ncbi:MAG TPA: YfhO family protein [Candidatus Acidoferrales bacterium]|jgi:hypothetical protein|nr:YfhO family protein [Candidatus Acidoferrales bacterium]
MNFDFRRHASLATFGMALALFAIVAAFYWRITLTAQYDWVWGPDLATQVMPWYQEQARSWNAGTFPLWDPYLWAGQPVLGQAITGGAYPLNWLLFLLPLQSHTGAHTTADGVISMVALQWYFVVIRFMAAAFCYWLCRDLGRSRVASLAGGLVFALGGFMGTTGWPVMVNGAVWIPLVFLFLLRSVRGEKWDRPSGLVACQVTNRPSGLVACQVTNRFTNAALSGLFLGLAWLSGHHQIPMFTAVAVAATWLFFLFRQRPVDWRIAGAALTAAVFTGCTGALQILPAYEYGHQAKRWVGTPEPLSWNQTVPYYIHETYDLKPGNLLGVVFPNMHAQFDPFIGVVALTLALIGIACCWRQGRVRLMTAVGLGGLLYALGQHSVFQGLLYAVIPTFDKARTPAVAVVIFEFGAAVLAAFGLDRLRGADAAPPGPTPPGPTPPSPTPPSPTQAIPAQPRWAAWAVLGFGAFVVALYQALTFANKMQFPGEEGMVITGFLALLLAALLFAWMGGSLTRQQACTLLMLLLIMELGNDYETVFADRTGKGRASWLTQMRDNRDIAGFLKQQPGFARTTIAGNAFVPNWGAWHGVEMWGGYLAGVTSNLLSFEFHKPEARLLYGVAYTIGAQPTPEAGDQVFRGQSGLNVYRNSAAFPRAWAVHKLVQARDAVEANMVMMGRPAEMRNQAVLLGKGPALDPCHDRDFVDLLEHGADRLLIRANMSCAGMVVLSDTYFPGWRARVDGKAAAIYEVNAAMRGVLVPAGLHTVTMRYRPASVIWGGLLTLLGILGAVALVVLGRIPSLPGRADAVRLAILRWLD